MKKTLAFFLMAFSAWAGSSSGNAPSRGNFLHIPQYQTTAALNLFLDPAGSDTNPCTASGAASACLTPQRVESLIPKGVRHPVTVTAAVGSYTGVYIDGHWFDPVSVTNGAYIKWVGTFANVTPATGTATGTASAGSAGSGATFGTLTDAAQTWTINDAALKGAIVEITGGTGSGQTRVIASNTATVLTIVGSWTAPTGTSTYAIRGFGTVFNTAVNSPAIPNTAAGTASVLRIGTNGGIRTPSVITSADGAAITFNRIKFAPSAAATGAVILQGPSQIAFYETSINANTSGAGVTANNGYGNYVILGTNYITSGTGSAYTDGNSNTAMNFTAARNNLFESSNASANIGVVTLGGSGNWSQNQFNANASGAFYVVFFGLGSPSTRAFDSSIMNCTAGGTTIGLAALGGFFDSVASIRLIGDIINSCPIGIQASGRSEFNLSTSTTTTITGTGAQTAGLQVSSGGKISINQDPTITGYTNDIVTDSTTSTYAAFLGLTPTAIFDLSFGSAVTKP